MQNMIDFCIRKGIILSNEKLKLLVFLSVLLRREKKERERNRGDSSSLESVTGLSSFQRDNGRISLFAFPRVCFHRIRDGGLHGKEDSNEEEPVPKNRGEYEDGEGKPGPTRGAR